MNKLLTGYNVFKLNSIAGSTWHDFIDIYSCAYTRDEREEIGVINSRIQSGQYEMYVCLNEQEVLGFYIFEKFINNNFILLQYLAEKKTFQGLGVVEQLCEHAIKQFFKSSDEYLHLLIISRKNESQFYHDAGFSRIELNFKVPVFHKRNLRDVDLLAMSRAPLYNTISGITMMEMIKHIYQDIYHTMDTDRRTVEAVMSIGCSNMFLIPYLQCK